MGYIVRMPQMGMEMEEGVVLEWTIEEGEEIEEDEVLLTVESEKAANDVEARETGVLRKILVEEGEGVPPGAPVGIVAGADEDLSAFEAELDEGLDEQADDVGEPEAEEVEAPDKPATREEPEPEPSEPVRATPEARELADEHDLDLGNVSGTGPQGVITGDDVRDAVHVQEPAEPAEPDPTPEEPIRASPGARRLAETKDVPLHNVEGTGPDGVIIEADVEAYLEADTAEPTPSDVAQRTVAETRELTRVQSIIAERLGESYRSAVHVTVNRTIDAGLMQAVRAAADEAGIDISLTDMLIKAVAAQQASHPEFNALVKEEDEELTLDLIEEVNVGVAVDIEAGLITPVIPDVGPRSIEGVATTRRNLTERALEGNYTSDDLSGGTITITNLGMFGIDHFDPVINPPEVAILGVGRIRDDGGMTLSLTFDHRVVNGADAARYLDDLATTLTDLGSLLSFFDDSIFE